MLNTNKQTILPAPGENSGKAYCGNSLTSTPVEISIAAQDQSPYELAAEQRKSTRRQIREAAARLIAMQEGLAEDKKDLERLRACIEDEHALRALLTQEREALNRLCGISLAQSQKAPMRLSERLTFVQMLLCRPAFDDSAILRGIEADYQRALAIARED